MTIKGAFGRLKVRWRVLLSRPDVHIETMRKIIYVCFLLHNFCEFNEQDVSEEWLQESERQENNLLESTDDAISEQPDEQTLDEPSPTANMVRMHLARRLFHDNWSVTRSTN